MVEFAWRLGFEARAHEYKAGVPNTWSTSLQLRTFLSFLEFRPAYVTVSLSLVVLIL
jgi:hypothetical protein